VIAGAYITDIDDDGCERSYVMYFNIYIVIFIRQLIFYAGSSEIINKQQQNPFFEVECGGWWVGFSTRLPSAR
jgi:hypothetical protein